MVGIPARTTQTLDVNAVSYRGCLDGYAAIMAQMFQISPMSSQTPLPSNYAAAWQTDRFLLGIGESNPFARRHAIQETQNSGHLIEISRYLSGCELGTSGDRAIKRVPGPIYVVDQQHAYHTVVSQFKVERTFVPKAMLGLLPDELRPEQVITSSSPHGWMLHTCMDDLYQSVQQNDQAIDRDLADRFLALLKVNLGVHPQRGDVRRQFREALREQISDYIEQNLGDPHLATTTLLHSFGVSRATLYRMFEEDGGVRRYIMERRAIRAVLDLAAAPQKRGQGRRVSDRWGFSTQPNFNRAIRRHFGVPPGRLFAAGAANARLRNGQPRLFRRFNAQTALAA